MLCTKTIEFIFNYQKIYMKKQIVFELPTIASMRSCKYKLYKKRLVYTKRDIYKPKRHVRLYVYEKWQIYKKDIYKPKRHICSYLKKMYVCASANSQCLGARWMLMLIFVKYIYIYTYRHKVWGPCICTCIFIFMYVYTKSDFMHIFSWVPCIRIWKCICIFSCICICTWIGVDICIRIRKAMYMCIFVWTVYMYMYMHMCIFMYMYTKSDIYIWQETYIYEEWFSCIERDLYIWKETCIYEKRHKVVTRDILVDIYIYIYISNRSNEELTMSRGSINVKRMLMSVDFLFSFFTQRRRGHTSAN